MHQPTETETTLISRNVSNNSRQLGTGIGGGKSFRFFIITLRHAASRSLNFDHVRVVEPSPHCPVSDRVADLVEPELRSSPTSAGNSLS